MGKILYGYEGMAMPVLFTAKGLVHLQRKIEGDTQKEREEKERKHGHPGKEIEEQEATDRAITMEWMNASPDVQVIAEEQNPAWHTYPSVPVKAYGYRKIKYIGLYPGIDLVYSFNENSKAGFEYSL